MSGLERERAARKARQVPFATMRADALLLAAINLPPVALRAYWIANATWTPSSKHPPGLAVVGYKDIAAPLRRHRGRQPVAAPRTCPSQSTIKTALEATVSGGFMDVVTLGSRPGAAGGGRGVSSAWRVFHRHAAAPPLKWPGKLHRPDGKVRLVGLAMLHDAHQLTPTALRALAFLIACRDRTKLGALVAPSAFALSARSLATRLRLSRSAAADAIAELVQGKRLILTSAAQGSRPSMYRLAQRYIRFKSAPANGE